jgi:hypothetical protein
MLVTGQPKERGTKLYGRITSRNKRLSYSVVYGSLSSFFAAKPRSVWNAGMLMAVSGNGCRDALSSFRGQAAPGSIGSARFSRAER